MIFLGLTNKEKLIEIERYKVDNNIEKVFIVSADKFELSIENADCVTYTLTIEYVNFYRWLQNINHRSLVVVNECLRTQNRHDLTYNCIRHYLNQTKHQLIFQKLPLIDTKEDFMILFDFDTRSRWKRMKFNSELIKNESEVIVKELPIDFSKIPILTDKKLKEQYQKEKIKLFSKLGVSDPHKIPRNLYLMAGMKKKEYCLRTNEPSLFSNGNDKIYLARNKRLNADCIFSYNDDIQGSDFTILEFPHRFIDFIDFLQMTEQRSFDVLVSDLKVDEWYFEKYTQWSNGLNDIYSDLQ